MSLQKITIRNSVLILMIVLAAATRSLNINHITEWVTFTPVGAVAMFAGTYFKDKVKAFLVPLITLFVSDLALNYAYYHKFMWLYGGWQWVYASFIIMVVIGMFIKNVNIVNVVAASLVSVLVHWLLTDISPWINSPVYAASILGYWQSLIAAIPFEKSLLIGNLLFGAVLYGGFELAKSKYTVLQTNQQLAV